MSKYLRLMNGKTSNAGDFEVKIGEVVESNTWNPNTYDPEKMGGFNFSTEDKIIRWIHRGDTLYDVEIPKDAKIIECPSINCPHGIFRANKIIMKNPRKLTEEMALNFYKKSDLPDKTYYQILVVLLYKNYVNTAKYVIKDRINKSNIDECLYEFEAMITNKHDGTKTKFSYDELWDEAKEIYDILLEIKNN